MGPREHYLVGMLGPKHSPRSAVVAADELPDTESGVHGDGETERKLLGEHRCHSVNGTGQLAVR
ncbi:MAG: hypothetical protein ACRDRH_15580 [Pseudonocardia sp.]